LSAIGLRRKGERRKIKYEEVYLHAYASVSEARASIGRYRGFYNRRRPHSSLAGKAPDQAYFNQPVPDAVAAKSKRKTT
jgi:putative transposase